MDDHHPSTPPETIREGQNGSDNHEFMVVFKKEALDKLKSLASFLDVPQEKLGDVLVKGLHIVEMAREGKIIIETKKERLEVDIKKL